MRSFETSTALAVVVGLGFAVASLPASAQGMAACDRDGNGYVSTGEAQDCDQQSFGEMAGDEDYVTEEQFNEAYPDTEGMFAEADADGDGQVSEDEWLSWREQGFAEAVGEDEDGMPADEYEDWNPAFPEGAGDQGIDEGSQDPSTYGEEQQQ
jgi:hypothetical protein